MLKSLVLRPAELRRQQISVGFQIVFRHEIFENKAERKIAFRFYRKFAVFAFFAVLVIHLLQFEMKCNTRQRSRKFCC